jgi:hypothetical protein
VRIELQEPIHLTYLYVNPVTNIMHLLAERTDDFYRYSIIQELKVYQEWLEFFLILLDKNSSEYFYTQQRLEQINLYLQAIIFLNNNFVHSRATPGQWTLMYKEGKSLIHLASVLYYDDYVNHFAYILSDAQKYPQMMSTPHALHYVEVEPTVLMHKLTRKQLKKLPADCARACEDALQPQLATLFAAVISNNHSQVNAQLSELGTGQLLLTTPHRFIDELGRHFSCSVYEYAIWSEKTDICRIFSFYMDAETSRLITEKVEVIKKIGLCYQYNGVECSAPQHNMSFVFKNLDFCEFSEIRRRIAGFYPVIHEATKQNYRFIPLLHSDYEELKSILMLQIQEEQRESYSMIRCNYAFNLNNARQPFLFSANSAFSSQRDILFGIIEKLHVDRIVPEQMPACLMP